MATDENKRTFVATLETRKPDLVWPNPRHAISAKKSRKPTITIVFTNQCMRTGP